MVESQIPDQSDDLARCRSRDSEHGGYIAIDATSPAIANQCQFLTSTTEEVINVANDGGVAGKDDGAWCGVACDDINHFSLQGHLAKRSQVGGPDLLREKTV